MLSLRDSLPVCRVRSRQVAESEFMALDGMGLVLEGDFWGFAV